MDKLLINKIPNDVYSFDVIKDYIIGTYTVSDWFSFTIYSDKAPFVNDMIKIDDNIYIVESVVDDTDDDDEYEQGLTYSKVWLTLNNK